MRVEEGVLLEEEALETPQLCVVRKTASMGDLEQRLRFAMVASVGGRRPPVSCEQVAAALKWRGFLITRCRCMLSPRRTSS
jgi:hypothetical protein